jgi:fructokinase
MFTAHRPDQIGISSFGPIDLNRNSDTWGSIMTAASLSKAGWAQYSLAQELAQKIYKGDRSNVFVVSDVYGAAIAEYKLANHQAEQALAYVTVGTGIGVGLYIKGLPSTVMCQKEGGHIMVSRHPKDKDFIGPCNSHKECVENFVSNNAIATRLGVTVDK